MILCEITVIYSPGWLFADNKCESNDNITVTSVIAEFVYVAHLLAIFILSCLKYTVFALDSVQAALKN